MNRNNKSLFYSAMIRVRFELYQLQSILLVSFLCGCVCENENTDNETILSEVYTVAKDSNLKVLAIGNSFTENATMYIPNILGELDLNGEIFFTKLILPSSSLEDHWNNCVNDNYIYTLSWVNGHEWCTLNYKTSIISTLMTLDWDIIVIQQVSGLSGCPESFDPFINNLMSLFKNKHKSVRVGWQMTWAYSSLSTHADFGRYNNDRTTMYEAIEQSLIKVTPYVDFVIPSGKVIEQIRNTELNTNKDLTSDGHHLESGLPCYALSCLWYEILLKPITNMSCLDLKDFPDGHISITDHSYEIVSKIIDSNCTDY